MKLNNKIYNWRYGVKRVQLRGSKNAGKMWDGREWLIVKYDWSKPFKYTTKTIYLDKKDMWKNSAGTLVIKLPKLTTKRR